MACCSRSRVQNEFVLDWVKGNFLPVLTGRITELTGWSVQVAWLVDQKLDSPPSPRPRRLHPVRPRPIQAGPPARLGSPVRPSSPPPLSDEWAAPERSRRAAGSRRTTRQARSTPRPPIPARRKRPPGSGGWRRSPTSTPESTASGASSWARRTGARARGGDRRGGRGRPLVQPALHLRRHEGSARLHLVHAIAHRVHGERPDARIIYVSAERFTNDFITSIQHHRMDEVPGRATAPRATCSSSTTSSSSPGASRRREEFFHTFNALHSGLDRRRSSSPGDKYPQHLERMEERLVSRFSWGLVADIQVPEARDPRRHRPQQGGDRGLRARRAT